ncbi:MAG: nitrate reductase [Pseudomonadota bacterium]
MRESRELSMAFEGADTKETATTCPYCGVGCGVLATPSADGLSAKVEGDPSHPSNFGKLCSKGAALGETLDLSERLLYPEVDGVRASWGDAMSSVARGFAETIKAHGPDSVALYVSGQILTEDYYVANKLMKGFIGASNIDTNSRLCMASSVVGHKRAFGTDTVPGCYEDLELADLIVMVGSNFAWCHPVLQQRVLAAKQARHTKIVVIDPRQTATTQAADLHLAIKPGADVALFNWLFWKLAQSKAFDASFVGEHTDGLSDALVTASSVSESDVEALTGLSASELDQFFRLVAAHERTVTVYSQGVNQSSSGSDKVNAIINTHLVTGRIGKPGMGPFSITGQPNAMGGREVGGLANQLAAHMDHKPDDLDRVARFWHAPRMTTGVGLKAIDMFDAVHDGRIKAIWIMATNPVVSMPQADKVREALETCPLVVVSDVTGQSDTAKLATVLLPATGWGEKSGTVTNSERRISRQRSFLKPPGEARHDWQAICDLARRMGYSGFDFESPAEIYREHAALSAFENDDSRDFDIGADADIDDDAYDAMAPFQWPKPADRARPGLGGRADHRFFADGQFYTPNRRAQFLAAPFKPAKVQPTEAFPLILNTGRVRDHWHTMTRTGKTPRLSLHFAEPFLEMHPADADHLALAHAELVDVASPQGSATLRLLVTDRAARGQVFAPMHWTARFSSNGRVDALVGSAHDPLSGQQESKFTPVSVTAHKPAWYGFGVFQNEPPAEILETLSYWSLARCAAGWRLECAGRGSASAAERGLLGRDIDVSLSLPGGHCRSASFDGQNLHAALAISAGQPVEIDRAWLSGALGAPFDDAARLTLLAGRAAEGMATGPVICSCHGIGRRVIIAAIADGAGSVEAVGAATCAGTNCGSCKPEIAGLLAGEMDPAVAEPIAAE